MCTPLSESLTKSIYTIDIVGKFLSSMVGSLQQEYLYSLLNIARVYFLLDCQGNSEVILETCRGQQCIVFKLYCKYVELCLILQN